MNIGKDKCELLKNIRTYIAEKYGLDYLPSECKHEGDCQGTCPKCDAELIDIQKQLDSKGITDISSDAVLNELFQAYLFSKDNNDDANSTSSVDQSSLSQDEDKHNRDSVCLQGDIASTPNEDSLGSLAREKNFIKSFVADKILFMECPVAGIAFHDVDEIWDELEVGTKLALVRDKYNKYDKNAIAVALVDDYEGDPDEFDFDFILGYIPKDKNQSLALFLDMGWQDMFEVEISSLKRYGSYSDRLHISIYIKHKDVVEPQEDDALRINYFDKKEEWSSFVTELWRKGYVYCRWLYLYFEHPDLPKKGNHVVFLYNDGKQFIMYLMLVIALGDAAGAFLDNPEDMMMLDDCDAYILTSVAGPIKVSNEVIQIPEEFLQRRGQPDKQLDKDLSDKLMNLFLEDKDFELRLKMHKYK